MKKIIKILMYFLLINVLKSETSILLINSSAEIDEDRNEIPDNWEKRGKTAIWEKEIFYEGKRSLGISEDGDEYWAGWVTVIEGIKESAMYLIKGMGKCEKIENYAQIWAYWLDEKNQHIEKEIPIGEKFIGTKEWEERSLIINAPLGAKKLKLVLASYQKKGSKGKVFFDNLEVIKLLDPPLGLGKKWNNFLYNNSFEIANPLKKNTPIGWRPSIPDFSKSLILWEDIGYKGKCISLENFEEKDISFLYSMEYKFKPNTFYIMNFYYKFNKKEGGSLYVFYPDGIKEIPNKGIRIDLPIEWNLYSFLFKTPEEVKKPYNICFSLYQKRNGLKVWIDEVELLEISVFE